MGFAVIAAQTLILTTVIFAITLYAISFNQQGSLIAEGSRARADALYGQRNTKIIITNITYTPNTTTITLLNNGSVGFNTSQLSLYMDNNYLPKSDDITIQSIIDLANPNFIDPQDSLRIIHEQTKSSGTYTYTVAVPNGATANATLVI